MKQVQTGTVAGDHMTPVFNAVDVNAVVKSHLFSMAEEVLKKTGAFFLTASQRVFGHIFFVHGHVPVLSSRHFIYAGSSEALETQRCVVFFEATAVIKEFMVIKQAVVLTVLSFFLMLSGATAWAEARQHSLGIDLVRPMDETQYGGMLGLSYQASMGSHSALVGTLARRSGYTLFEGLYKVYGDDYFDGPFAAAGVVTGRYDGEDEIGLIGSLGYELSLDQNLVISGAVECTWGTMDHPSTSHRNPIFRPSLTLILAF